jgi:hypothetical protein
MLGDKFKVEDTLGFQTYCTLAESESFHLLHHGNMSQWSPSASATSRLLPLFGETFRFSMNVNNDEKGDSGRNN